MDKSVKNELNKQKKLVDCVNYLNSVLDSLEHLENYQAKILPIMDGFDLTHCDTYLELTENLKRELFYIGFFSRHAANKLTKYRELSNSEKDIYSVKEQNNLEKQALKPLANWEQIQQKLDQSEDIIKKLLSKVEADNLEEKQLKDSSIIKQQLNIADKKKRERQAKQTKKIATIEARVLRLEWIIFLMLLLQFAIFIKIIT